MESTTKENYIALADFTFKLSIEGLNLSQTYVFQEVSNALETSEPIGEKRSNLILKRGIIAVNSELASWCSNTVSASFKPISTKQSIFL